MCPSFNPRAEVGALPFLGIQYSERSMISGIKIHNKVIAAQVKKILREAKSARAPLRHKQVNLIGNRLLSPVGDYFENFAHSIANRIIDIFDDCILLIKHRRFPSACVLSRGIIETHAYAAYARQTAALVPYLL